KIVDSLSGQEIHMNSRVIEDYKELGELEYELINIKDSKEDFKDFCKIKLEHHQKVGSAFLCMAQRAILADAVGVQKTGAALNAALMMKQMRGLKKVIYFTLNSVKWQVRDEIHKFTNEEAIVIDGEVEERKK